MSYTQQEIDNDISQIVNETQEGGNTKSRVGALLAKINTMLFNRAYEYTITYQPVANFEQDFEKAGKLTRFWFGSGLTDLKIQVNGGAQQTISVDPTTRVWTGEITYTDASTITFIPTSSTEKVKFTFSGEDN
jgi:hypothetical protein